MFGHGIRGGGKKEGTGYHEDWIKGYKKWKSMTKRKNETKKYYGDNDVRSMGRYQSGATI